MAENNRKTICVCCIFLQRMISGFLQWVRKLLNLRIMLPIFAWIMYCAALAIGGCFVYRTFRYQDNHVPESINININDEKGKKKELSPEGKAYLMEQLHSALMEVTGKAESAYNEKFAALLTVLSIFGIAWPIILGLLQFRFNEGEIKKIQNADNKIKDIEKIVNEAKEQAGAATEAAFDSRNYLMDYQRSINELEDVKNNIYNDYTFVCQTLASYFYNIKVAPAKGKNQEEYLLYSILALEMALKSLYYACLIDNAMVIADMPKKIIRNFEILDDFIEKKQVTQGLTMKHLYSFNWELISSKIDSESYEKIKKLYDKHFCRKGA